MYDDSSITDAEFLSADISVAAMLGIKGGLRLRQNHTASSKAHVILRRVEPTDDDGEEPDVVSFRLFANKHINLKPGKELLLTVASVDGRFKDRVVLFEGDLRRSDDDSDSHEGTTQVEEEPQVIDEDEEFSIPQAAMPPKMRRQWTRKVEEVSPVVFRVPVPHASVGVQAQPDYTSSSVQACPAQYSVSMQVQPARASASIQTCSSHTSSAVQVDPPSLPTYTSLDTQTDPIPSFFDLLSSPWSRTLAVPADAIQHTSLSPMLLSAPDSPAIPPLFLGFPDSRAPSEDMQMSPPAVKLEEIEEPIPPAVCVKQEVKEERIDSPRLPPPAVVDMFDLGESAPAAPWILSPPWISFPVASRPNLFVSSGFVPDFVGAVPLQDPHPLAEEPKPPYTDSVAEADTVPAKKPLTRSHRHRATKRARLRAEAQASAAVDAPTLIVDDSEIESSATGETIGGEATAPAQPASSPSPLPPQRVRATQNAVASSSKVVAESLPPPVPVPSSALSRTIANTSTSILPRELKALVGRAKEKAPAVVKDRVDTHAPSRGATPPPDPKALAYIPAGPASNPLNIRPSAASARPTMLPPVLARPPATAVAAAKAKKRVLVGRGWPFVRAVAALAPGAPTLTPTPTPATTTSHPPSLSSVAGYASPSPPPHPPVAKWKRIDSEISIADDESVDMDLSAPPSPVGAGRGADGDGVPALASLKERMLDAPVAEPSSPMLFLDRRPRSTEVKSGLKPKTEEGPSLLSRVFPAPNAAQPDPAFVQHQGRPSSSQKPIPMPSAKANSKKCALPLPIHHSLPAKPPESNINMAKPPRGIKRERPASPDLWTAPGIVRIQRRKPRWPTIEWTHSALLKGDGDLGIRRIAFSADGSCFALHCWDRSLRIWNARTRLEIAHLSHNAQVIGLAWVDGEAAVMSLGEDGVLAKWTRVENHWEWGRLINVGAEKRAPEDTVCLAHTRDRIAVAFPRSGVKVWKWYRGQWLAQRSIMRTNVTALKFVEGGDALLGGTREGAVWHCAVPNGTMKVYAFLQSSITSIDINPTGTHALIAQAGGSACLVGLGSHEEKRVGQSYLDTELRDGGLGAIFATQGQAVVFGAVEGSLLVWDTHKGAVVYGMEHAEGDLIQAVASCGGPQGCVVTGTRQGRLAWWPQPTAQAQSPPNASRKRAKVK
ncbi:hypothetical protein B0H17DRAFT_1079814 [Mycena rosella]|uniref:WD40 repeat-like protein n=1 Tax=Mycena rosella TaxID=1033263 RepID=A0AAD7D3G5_MYCRO|nr:hypothetical protein B0H17DRAFT_1079814 [Mycena rosella]